MYWCWEVDGSYFRSFFLSAPLHAMAISITIIAKPTTYTLDPMQFWHAYVAVCLYAITT